MRSLESLLLARTGIGQPLWRAAWLGAAVLAASLVSSPAFAHVELLSPTPRAAGRTEGNLKVAPCGQDGQDGRTDRVTVFEPGQSITVDWIEYVDHPSYYRVAFAPEGDDFPMRTNVPQKNSLIVPESPDVQLSEEQAVFVGSSAQLLAVVPEVNGTASSADIVLPEMSCENCTLQLIQVMYNNPPPRGGYYQCADIALRVGGGASNPGGTASSGATSGSAGSAGTGSAATGSAGTSSAATGSAGASMAGMSSIGGGPVGVAGAGAAGAGTGALASSGGGGCSLALRASDADGGAAFALLGLAWAGSWRRRRPARFG